MVEPQSPVVRTTDLSLSGAKKAWMSAGVGVLGVEVAALILRWVIGANFFGVIPPFLLFVVAPAAQGLLNFAATWLAKNKPKL